MDSASPNEAIASRAPNEGQHMQKVTIRYGVDTIEKQFTVPVTIGSLRLDQNIRAGLGYGDNVKFLINGIEMSNDVIVPNGATVVVETAANSKAN
jgi:hypothetical protein